MGLPLTQLPHLNGRDQGEWKPEDIAEQPITLEIAMRLQRLTRVGVQVVAFGRNDPRVKRA